MLICWNIIVQVLTKKSIMLDISKQSYNLKSYISPSFREGKMLNLYPTILMRNLRRNVVDTHRMSLSNFFFKN